MCKFLLQKALALILFGVGAFFASIPMQGTVYAQQEGLVRVSRQEFYFYDEEGRRAPLAIAQKIIVKFNTPPTDDELAEFLKRLDGSIGKQKFEPWGEGAFEITFLPTFSQDDVLWKIRDILRFREEEKGADVAPVFMLLGKEAVVDGIIIEPTTLVTASFVEESLQSIFDGVLFHEFSKDGKRWLVSFKDRFFLGKTAPSLHVLSFANILRTSEKVPWIKKRGVSLKFRLLGAPITARVTVTPPDGTIGEKRTVSLVVQTFDPAIRVQEQLLPEFGEGNFAPKMSGSPPPASFFKVLGQKTRREVKGEFGTATTFSWSFTIYAREDEWVIPEQDIPYFLGEEQEPKNVRSAQMTFTTLSHLRRHIGNETIVIQSEMPPAPLLPRILSLASLKIDDSSVQEASRTEPPPHILDTFVWLSGGTAKSAKTGVVLLLAMTLFYIGVVFVKAMRARAPASDGALDFDEARFLNACKTAFDGNGKECYRLFAEAGAQALNFAAPSLPKDEFSAEQVKRLMDEDTRANALFFGEPLALVLKLGEALGRRYVEDSAPDSEEKTNITLALHALKRALLARVEELKKEGGQPHGES